MQEKNMKSKNEKAMFVELRAQGLSFDKIAAELGVSKPTLLQWNREFSREIANAAYFEFETLLNQYKLAKKMRIDTFAAILEKAMTELKSRPLTTLRTKDLLMFISTLESKIKEEIEPIHYFTGENEGIFDCIDIEPKEKTLPLIY
jgi:hypothetical protein